MKKVITFLIALAVLFAWSAPASAMLEKDFVVGKVVQINPQTKYGE